MTGLEARLRDLAARVPPLDETAQAAAREHMARIGLPIDESGRLGTLGGLLLQLAGVRGQSGHWSPARLRIRSPYILVAAADHGFALTGDEPPDTAHQVQAAVEGRASINILARQARATLVVADLGVAADIPASASLRRLPVARGTSDIFQGPAMTREQALQAMAHGVTLAEDAIHHGADLIALGALGAGGYASALAIELAYSGDPVMEGMGTAQPGSPLAAVRERSPDISDPVDVLGKLGGFEVGALAGAILGAGAARVPVLLDELVTAAAARIAGSLSRAVRLYLVAAQQVPHTSTLRDLCLPPLLSLGLDNPGGCGAALAIPLVRAAGALATEVAAATDADAEPGEAPGWAW